MSHRGELRADEAEERGLELNAIAYLVVTEARQIAGGLDVRVQVEDVDEHLHVALALRFDGGWIRRD